MGFYFFFPSKNLFQDLKIYNLIFFTSNGFLSGFSDYNFSTQKVFIS